MNRIAVVICFLFSAASLGLSIWTLCRQSPVAGFDLTAQVQPLQERIRKLEEAKPSSKRTDPSLDLLQAAERGQLSRVEELLASGVSANDKDAEGETALMKAAANNHVAVIRSLFAKRADCDERDKNGEDALMKAAEKGHLAAVQLLLGLDSQLMLKAQDRNGMTVLMKAAANGHVLVVKEIVHFKTFFGSRFDIQAKDVKGRTALDHAREKGHPEIVAFLESQK